MCPNGSLSVSDHLKYYKDMQETQKKVIHYRNHEQRASITISNGDPELQIPSLLSG